MHYVLFFFYQLDSWNTIHENDPDTSDIYCEECLLGFHPVLDYYNFEPKADMFVRDRIPVVKWI